MRWFWRLGVIGVLALASFVLAIGRFSAAAEKGCAQRARIPSLMYVSGLTRTRTFSQGSGSSDPHV